MILLVDAGNSRIKWALVHGREWLISGVLPVGHASELHQQLTLHCDKIGKQIQEITEVWVSNVAGEAIGIHIRRFAVDINVEMHFIVSREEQCGVKNFYSTPGELGSDRWAALIGAWKLVYGECLVVNCGTATTIDALSGQGEFLGGLILPGVDLILNSLRNTTGLLTKVQFNNQSPGNAGNLVSFPKNTADAMFSGAIKASCGAIREQYEMLDHDNSPVVLSGGAAEVLQGHLNLPLRIVDNLVLRGLCIISQEMSQS